MYHPDRIAHTTSIVIPVIEHWLDPEIGVGVVAVCFLSHYLSGPLPYV